MAGQPLQVDHRIPLLLQAKQQPGLAHAGQPPQHQQPTPFGAKEEISHVSPEGLVPPDKLPRRDAGHVEKGGESTAAHTAAPAENHYGPPAFPPRLGHRFHHGADFRGYQLNPQPPGGLRTFFLVKSTDNRPLLVVENGDVDRSRDGGVGKFGRGARVHQEGPLIPQEEGFFEVDG